MAIDPEWFNLRSAKVSQGEKCNYRPNMSTSALDNDIVLDLLIFLIEAS